MYDISCICQFRIFFFVICVSYSIALPPYVFYVFWWNKVSKQHKSSDNSANVASHTRTVVRECFKGDEASYWKRPLATPKPLNRSSPKLARMITPWTAPGMQNFVAIGLRVSAPQIRDFAEPLEWLVCSFFGFFNKATAYTPELIFTQNTSNDVVPGKEMPFGGLDEYIFYLDP